MKFRETTLAIPAHWVSAIINGDETSFDYYDNEADYQAFQAFCEAEIPAGAIVDCGDAEPEFNPFHDARGYGVLPCDAVDCVIYAPA